MPRRKQLGDRLSVRLPTGMLAEIEATLGPNETVQDVVRIALMVELQARRAANGVTDEGPSE